MASTDSQWLFLGYDLRHLVSYFQAGWSDFLQSKGRAISSTYAEPVEIRVSSGVNIYCSAGKLVTACETVNKGVLLNSEVVLGKEVFIPECAEEEIAAFVGMEVGASSPFVEQDTLYGWKLLGRENGAIRLLIVISSWTLVNENVDYDGYEAGTHEIWAEVEGEYISFITTATITRKERETSGAKRLGFMALLAVCLLIVIGVIPAGVKFLEMQKVREFYSVAESRAVAPAQYRHELNVNSQLISDLVKLEAEAHDPLLEIGRLSKLLPDDAFVSSMTMGGGKIRINGAANSVTHLIQVLSSSAAFEKVESTSAIIRNAATGKERFSIIISLRSEEGA